MSLGAVRGEFRSPLSAAFIIRVGELVVVPFKTEIVYGIYQHHRILCEVASEAQKVFLPRPFTAYRGRARLQTL
jgi:hypothetical protein